MVVCQRSKLEVVVGGVVEAKVVGEEVVVQVVGAQEVLEKMAGLGVEEMEEVELVEEVMVEERSSEEASQI